MSKGIRYSSVLSIQVVTVKNLRLRKVAECYPENAKGPEKKRKILENKLKFFEKPVKTNCETD